MPTTTTGHIAKQKREFYIGKNWTWVNLQETIAYITFEEVTACVSSLNIILALVFHIHYYLDRTMQVFHGQPLDAHDKYSFDHPELSSESEWTTYKESIVAEAELFTQLIEKMPDTQLWETMVNKKYGNYYRNLQGIIEHGHYHLGQVVILKKMIRENKVKA